MSHTAVELVSLSTALPGRDYYGATRPEPVVQRKGFGEDAATVTWAAQDPGSRGGSQVTSTRVSWKSCASPIVAAAAAARASAAGSALTGTSARLPQCILPSTVLTLWRQPPGVVSRTMPFGMPKGGCLSFSRFRLTMEPSNLVGLLTFETGGRAG